MKTLKRVISYLNWQQYAMGSDLRYNLPKTLCSAFWATLFGVITLPFTWIGNVYNAIRYKFRIGYQEEGKVNMFISAVVHFLILVCAAAGDAFMFKEFGINPLTSAFFEVNPFIFYLKALGIGVISMIVISIAAGLLIGAIFGIIYIVKHFTDQADDEDTVVGKVTELISSTKNKYCPMIDWSDVEMDSETKMYEL
jgi:hypothetical protein